ncbi:hypothetical protein GDO81_008888 [Engystomops pustulosus]|uniref:Uncharacterized protein n=1 Tax=Engystomops pustulosus TaxID=76066 RepID=A0AAV7BMY6_ENGPU|nr:hypothetical protein GDO81_008888 [Engystomops pustulosus]
MESGAVYLLLLSYLTGSAAQPPCTLITPSVLRADTMETIVLDGHNSGFEAQIKVQDFPLKKQLYVDSTVFVNNSNDFLGTTTIQIKSEDLLTQAKKTYYVSVQVISTNCKLEKVLLMSFHSGYIFIQTDKTIYTPGSQVMYRVYPLNYVLKPTKQSVIFEILNPEGVVTFRNQWVPDKLGMISKNYELPELATYVKCQT